MPLPKRRFWWTENVNADAKKDSNDIPIKQKYIECNPTEANLISSAVVGRETHCPVIDIDHRVYILPSTTPGNSHLYIDKDISWDGYKKILDAFLEVGLIQKAWYDDAIACKMSFVRPPWVSKGENIPKPKL